MDPADFASACTSASTCASELHHVVSLAGGALALNLAYLNLERFRYAKAIQNHSRQVVDKFEKAEGLPKGTNLDQVTSYRKVKELATIPDTDDGDDADDETKPTAGLWKEFGVTGLVYEWIFVKRMDIIICSIFVVVSVVALALGSGHPIGILEWTCSYFDKARIGVSYWTLAMGIAVPMVFLMVGGYIQSKYVKLAGEVQRNLGEMLQALVPGAKLKDDSSAQVQ